MPDLGARSFVTIGLSTIEVILGVEQASLDRAGIKLDKSLPREDSLLFMVTGALPVSGETRALLETFGWQYDLGPTDHDTNSDELLVGMNFAAQTSLAKGLSEKFGVKLCFLNVQQLEARGGLPKVARESLLARGLYYFIGTDNRHQGTYFDVDANKMASIDLDHRDGLCGVVLGRTLDLLR